jgi:GH35 family endo-1,4-beta-xylanase
MNRRQFLRCGALVATGGPLLPCVWRLRANESATREALLERAQDGIQRHRRSDLTVVAFGPDRAAMADVAVEVRQLRHEFRWGANLFGWARSGDPDMEAAYRSRFAALFNFATLGFYWEDYEPVEGQPRYAHTDEALEWCLAHGIACKGHPLVWANIPDPDWLPADPGAIRAASLGRVRDLVARYRGRIDLWDVVNEPSLLMWAETRLGAWAQSVGTYSFVRQHLEAAREANPQATLLINEVLTDYPVYSLLNGLREAGRLLFDGVGIQSHMHRGAWSLARLWALCDRFGELGVPLHFTELTVLSGVRLAGGGWTASTPEAEVDQARHVVDHYTLLFGHPVVQAVSWWDLSDRGAWKEAPAGLLRRDMSPKPAYDRLRELIHGTWWTGAQGPTDNDGRFVVRAFHGRHRITVRWPDGSTSCCEAECARGGRNVIEMSWSRRINDGNGGCR